MRQSARRTDDDLAPCVSPCVSPSASTSWSRVVTHNLWSARGLCAPVAHPAPLRVVAVRGHAARGCEGGSDPAPGLPGPGHSGRAGRPEFHGVAPTLACRCQQAERVRPERADDKSTCWFEEVGHVTNPMQSPSVLPVDPAGPADPASARFASAGQARLRTSRLGETRKVLEKRRAIDRVSHEDPQAIIIVGSVTTWLANLKSTMREWNRTETLSGATVRPTALPLTFSVHFPTVHVVDGARRRNRNPFRCWRNHGHCDTLASDSGRGLVRAVRPQASLSGDRGRPPACSSRRRPTRTSAAAGVAGRLAGIHRSGCRTADWEAEAAVR